MTLDQLRHQAARAALEHLPASGVIGLGSGSTVRHFLEGLVERIRAGHRYLGVPTSSGTRAIAESIGIPLLGDEGPWDIDLCVDGADEVSDALDLIKGGGGAHAREKLVNAAARRNVIIVDASKRSARLGTLRPVPVEVQAFGHGQTARRLAAHGEATLRLAAGGPWRTDGGNLVYDVRTGPIDEPRRLDAALRSIPGVVETGLFCGRADLVIVAGAERITELGASAGADGGPVRPEAASSR